MEVQSSSDDIHRKCVRTRHIRLLRATEPVFGGIPRDDDAVARCRVFLEQRHECSELVAAEMFAPPIAVRHRDDICGIGEAIPNFGEVAQKVGWLAESCDKTYLLPDEHFDGGFAERK